MQGPEPEPEPEPKLQLGGQLLQHQALSEGPPLSQLPAGRGPFAGPASPLPAHPAFSLVTDIEGSWTLSFLISPGGGKEGTGAAASVKLLGASTSTTLGRDSGLGIWREPPTLCWHKNPQGFIRSNGSMTPAFGPGNVEMVPLTHCSQDARGRPVLIHHTCPHPPPFSLRAAPVWILMGVGGT